MQQLRNLRFQQADNDLVLCYSKTTEARDNILLVVVILDPWHAQEAFINVPLEEFGWLEGETYQVHDLLTDERYLWSGRRNFVRLDPQRQARACLPHPPQSAAASRISTITSESEALVQSEAAGLFDFVWLSMSYALESLGGARCAFRRGASSGISPGLL